MPVSSKEKFFVLLHHYPRLVGFWDEENASLDVDAITSEPLSGGEKVVASWLVAIWLGSPDPRLPVVPTDLTRLSDDSLRPLAAWVASPFKP